ncbi:hypothetical protein BD769DRAFT_1392817 [Suillus cothurnatus]|nr:hypothetical protein BD769DRAFT_1392817 [Suillus cothurnatus]
MFVDSPVINTLELERWMWDLKIDCVITEAPGSTLELAVINKADMRCLYTTFAVCPPHSTNKSSNLGLWTSRILFIHCGENGLRTGPNEEECTHWSSSRPVAVSTSKSSSMIICLEMVNFTGAGHSFTDVASTVVFYDKSEQGPLVQMCSHEYSHIECLKHMWAAVQVFKGMGQMEPARKDEKLMAFELLPVLQLPHPLFESDHPDTLNLLSFHPFHLLSKLCSVICSVTIDTINKFDAAIHFLMFPDVKEEYFDEVIEQRGQHFNEQTTTKYPGS